jgi:hypothetical protein
VNVNLGERFLYDIFGILLRADDVPRAAQKGFLVSLEQYRKQPRLGSRSCKYFLV